MPLTPQEQEALGPFAGCVWEDLEGNRHFDIPAMCVVMGETPTKENVARLSLEVKELLEEQIPGIQLILTNHPKIKP